MYRNIFLSNSNFLLIFNRVSERYHQNGGHANEKTLTKVVNLLMNKFSQTKDLDSYNMVYSASVKFIDYVETLKIINSDFMKWSSQFFKQNEFNPYREFILVGDIEHKEYKLQEDLLVEDKNTLNFWEKSEIHVNSGNFRNNNQIPLSRVSMHNRHYDRTLDGLNPMETENFISGYFLDDKY